MSTPNPLEHTHSSPPPPISAKTFYIAGLITLVYGLEEVPKNCKSISCLWLLHPRLKSKDDMSSIGASCIHDWNQRQSNDKSVGLIAVAFDQRNHGSRMVEAKANEAWREGNETHAQDMFSIYHGTALDTSLLIDHLGSYIFNRPEDPPINQHLVLGVSLGGHAAWQALFNEPKVTAGVVIIGCPDYARIMTDRARLSKLPTYTHDSGASFIGSPSFPSALSSALRKSDPHAMLLCALPMTAPYLPTSTPSPGLQASLRPLLTSTIAGKKILVCSGGADKLVPYACSKPFLDFLLGATGEGGWWKEGGVYLEDNVYEGVGHAFSEGMRRDAVKFVGDVLEGKVMGKREESGAKL